MMSHLPITDLFNAYDLQINPGDSDKIRSQEVVAYFEARFRVILQTLPKRCEEDQKWMYKVLFHELVLFVKLVTVLLSHARSLRNYVSPTLVWQLQLANHSTSRSL